MIESTRDAVTLVLERVGFLKRAAKSVFLKPNFTYPFFKPGVTTTREVMVAVIEYLKDHGCTRIVTGEGEGGYNAFSMDETFKNYRLDELVRSHGIRW